MAATESSVLFVGGYGRSGSTIIELLMSNAPGVTVLGEVRHLFGRVVDDRESCSCGEEVTACKHWGKVLAAAFPDGYDRPAIVAAFRHLNRVAVVPQLMVPWLRTRATRAHLELYYDTFTALYAGALEVSGGSVAVDSSKYPMHGLAIMKARRERGAGFRSMLLVRDPRAVAHSWENPKQRPEIAYEVRMMPRHHFLRSALAWVTSNYLTGLIRWGRSAPFRRQRYEDFVDTPLEQLRQIVTFGGGDGDSLGDEVFTVDRSRIHTIAGNPLESLGAKVEVRGSNSWRAAMPAYKRLLVRAVCWPQMLRYRYRGI